MSCIQITEEFILYPIRLFEPLNADQILALNKEIDVYFNGVGLFDIEFYISVDPFVTYIGIPFHNGRIDSVKFAAMKSYLDLAHTTNNDDTLPLLSSLLKISREISRPHNPTNILPHKKIMEKIRQFIGYLYTMNYVIDDDNWIGDTYEVYQSYCGKFPSDEKEKEILRYILQQKLEN